MKNILVPVSVCSLWMFASCGGSPENIPDYTPDPLPEVVEPDPVSLTWEELKAGTTAENTVISIEGYVGDIGTYVSSSNGEYTIPIYERRNQGAGTHLGVYVMIGDYTNCVASLPDNFGPSDYKIYCDDSTVVTTGDKVRVTASLYSSSMPGYYSADGMKIEAIEDDFDATLFEGAVPLTDAIIADTADKELYCYITGKLALPSMVFSWDNGISLDLKNGSVKGISSVKLPVNADRPSSMSDLPDNYTNNDLVVRDYTGAAIPVNTTVKIYGLWQMSTIYSGEKTGMFYPEEIARN